MAYTFSQAHLDNRVRFPLKEDHVRLPTIVKRLCTRLAMETAHVHLDSNYKLYMTDRS